MPRYSEGDRFIREHTLQGEVAGDITIELLEFDDPDLNLWSYKVTDVDYGEDVSPRCYYEGRTVGCRIKETVLDEFEQL